jgi:NADP-dependent aldehyde dehydrogenase
VGPVLVFAASNFPFAFSVAGGDTASALAAGCPVVVKAHPGHPRTSERTAEVVGAALSDVGLPAGTFAVIHGVDAGVEALKDPRISAASFTGSVHGGRALWDIATSRDVPIPFFAEMGSLNPVFVSPGAVAARGGEIAEGYVGSYTLGVGQFCTKPGLIFLPKGHGLTAALVDAVRSTAPGRMLLDRIHTGHAEVREALLGHPGIEVLVQGELGRGEAATAAASLLATDVPTLLRSRDALLNECFGPTSVLVEYDGLDQALEGARAFEGNLTGTVHAEDGEDAFSKPLLRALRDRVGRVVWNGWPTGVAVCWAMHHGGPYPATTTAEHTSVGMTAIRRFLRPVSYQGVPQDLLPEVLKDRNSLGVPRRIDGRITTGDVS